MTEEKASFLAYTKAAFMNQYNLILSAGVLGFAAMADAWQVLIPIWLGAEMLWVLGLATNERFQNLVNVQEKRSQQQDQEKLLVELPKPYVKRYQDLKQRYEEIQKASEMNRSDTRSLSVWQPEIDKLDYVLSSFLRLVHYQVNLQKVIGGFDEERIHRELLVLQKKIETSSDYLKQQYQKYADILQSRLDKAKQAKEIGEAIWIQVSMIEEQFKLIQEQIVLVKSPTEFTDQLDFLVQGISDIENQQHAFLDLKAELEQKLPVPSVTEDRRKKERQRQKE